MKKEHLRIEISKLKPNPKNPKQHDVALIQGSIKELGFVDDIVIDENNVILAGHGRLKALKELGTIEIDVIRVSGWTEAEKEKYLLLSNKSVEKGGRDNDLLKEFDEEMLSATGWESEELDQIFDLGLKEDDFNAEEEYEKIKEPKAKYGDIYQLGKHRLMCGDAIKKEDVEKLMNGEEADMIFCDPPYNVDYSGRGKKTSNKIMMDNQSQEEFVKFSEKFIQNLSKFTKDGGVFYICSGWSSYPTFVYALRVNGLYFSQPIIWVKNVASMGWNNYRYKHEQVIKVKNRKRKNQPILYGWKNGRHYFISERDETDVWEIKRRASNTMVHPTQKPLELIGRAIRNSSKRDEMVLDLFGGSGSTLISAEKEGRKAFLMELDPKYCDVIIKRFENYTGQKALKING